MGSFAGLWREKGSPVPPEKFTELDERMAALFRAGSMMEVCCRNVSGKTLTTISPPAMRGLGISVTYNYFEDAFWENAGYYQRDHFVWSEKVGNDQFSIAVRAAYALQGQYTVGMTMTVQDGVPVGNKLFAGWFNYLFREKFYPENSDPWKVYQVLHRLKCSECDYRGIDCESFLTDSHSPLGLLGVYASRFGVDYILSDRFAGDDGEDIDGTSLLSRLRQIRGDITQYQARSGLSGKAQLETLVQAVREFCGYVEDDPSAAREWLEKTDASIRRAILLSFVCDCFVLTMQIIAAAYGADFWDIWEKVRDVVEKMPGKEPDREPAEPVTTMRLFHLDPDDMAFYWIPGGDIRFPEPMRDWLREVREKYRTALAGDLEGDHPAVDIGRDGIRAA